MFAIVLGFLKSRLGLAAVGLGIGMAFAGVQTWRLHSTQVTVAQQQVVIVQLNANVTTLKANQAELQGAIDQANAAITKLSQQAKEAEANAAQAARVVLKSDALRQRDAKIKGAGPQVMNQWLQENFGHGR